MCNYNKDAVDLSQVDYRLIIDGVCRRITMHHRSLVKGCEKKMLQPKNQGMRYSKAVKKLYSNAACFTRPESSLLFVLVNPALVSPVACPAPDRPALQTSSHSSS